MIRRLVLMSAAAVLLTSTAASAAGHTVSIVDFDFNGSPTTAALGDTVHWSNTTGHDHTSTDDTPLSLWSFVVHGGTTRDRTFRQAGTYAYHCAIHTFMHGKVVVPMQGTTSLLTGHHGSITVATVSAPSGFRYVIQRAAPGGSFRAWRTISSATTTWSTGTVGSWRFRAALLRTSSSARSGWSPTLTVHVSH